jgi:hypothetical protein
VEQEGTKTGGTCSENESEHTCQKRFSAANLAFSEDGKFNRYLDEDDMLRFYQDIIDNRIKPPGANGAPKKRRSMKINVQGIEESPEQSVEGEPNNGHFNL